MAFCSKCVPNWARPRSGTWLRGWHRVVQALGLVLLFSGTACTREDIRVYDATKEQMAVRADLPPGWQELSSGDSGMRAGSYIVRGAAGEEAQISVVPLPGVSGTEIDNVNRWRNQVGLEPIKEAELESHVQPVTIAGDPARMFEMAGTGTGTPTRILAAVLKHADTAWFFKMMGDDDLVREQKANFVKFLASYELPHDHAHEHDSAATPAPPHPPVSSGPALGTNWAVPQTWQPTAPGLMQDAKFVVSGGKAAVTLSIMAGTGGGLLANINRWRTEQLGLPPASEKDIETLAVPLDLPEAKGTLIDMLGASQRMIVAIVPRGANTWFFKLMGEDAIVAAEKNHFVEFVKSSK